MWMEKSLVIDEDWCNEEDICESRMWKISRGVEVSRETIPADYLITSKLFTGKYTEFIKKQLLKCYNPTRIYIKMYNSMLFVT